MAGDIACQTTRNQMEANVPTYPILLAALGMAPLTLGLIVALRAAIELAETIEVQMLAGDHA